MIHRIEDNGSCFYLISAYHVWRPGCFESEKAARKAQRLRDEDLNILQQEAIKIYPEKRVITEQQIKNYRKLEAK